MAVELQRLSMSEGAEIPAADDLAVSVNAASTVRINGPVDLVRGELLMSEGGNIFVSATKSGMETAKELAILADDVLLSDETYTTTAAYFLGHFRGERVILSFETESDDHAELIAEIAPVLREHGIFIA